MDIANEKYNNELPFPKLRRQKFPEPKRGNFKSYAEHGIAMDEWERDVIGYDHERPHLIEAYRRENNRLNDLFMYDLLDDMGWLPLSDSKQQEISAYIWETGDGNKNEMYDVAYNMCEMVNELTKG